MKRYIKIALIVFATLPVFLIALFVSALLTNKYIIFPHWVINDLKGKYSEEMIIENVTFGEYVWNAYVSTKDLPDLNFVVSGHKEDLYLERCLEYDAEEYMENTLYKQLSRPPKWNEIPSYIKLESMQVQISDEYTVEETKNYIENNCRTSQFSISNASGEVYSSWQDKTADADGNGIADTKYTYNDINAETIRVIHQTA